MNLHRLVGSLAAGVLALAGCGGSNSPSSTMPAQASQVRVRFVEGAPLLETLVGSTPLAICPGASAPCYLQVNGQTVSQAFYYGSMTSFVSVTAGAFSLVARDTQGYAVGPLKVPALAQGGRYTLVVVGSYPNYRVLAFEEPASSSNARLSLYEASPAVAQSDFGSFRASSSSDFRRLGTAKFGTVATVALGKSVSNFGGYVGSPNNPLGSLTLAQVNSFDSRNVLPFHAASRLSLFLFDAKSGSASGPVFGSLDR